MESPLFEDGSSKRTKEDLKKVVVDIDNLGMDFWVIFEEKSIKSTFEALNE